MNDQFPEGMQRALAALYSREPVTDADRAEHRRLVAAQADRDDLERIHRASYKDLLEFAMAHGFDGSPKYQREAVKCLQKALNMIQGDS